jgi:ornithine cyclodeaminase
MITIGPEQIASLPLLRESVGAIRDAYISVTDGRAQLPPVGYLGFPDRNADCHVKFGYIQGDPIFVVKMSSGFYDNPKRGLPSNNGIMIAVSAETGEVVAILDDRGLLTEVRTAVGGAIATLALARPDAEVVGVVGAGTQARAQIRALAAIAGKVFEFVVWGRNGKAASELARNLLAEGVVVGVTADLETLCGRADIIITTTPSAQALVLSEWVGAGTHITAVGADAPGKQELAVSLVARAGRLVADLVEQSVNHGEFSHAHASLQIEVGRIADLGSVLAGAVEGRSSAEEITIADLTGLAVQDIAIARVALHQLGVC